MKEEILNTQVKTLGLAIKSYSVHIQKNTQALR